VLKTMEKEESEAWEVASGNVEEFRNGCGKK
jgi:hypothetical protein